MTNQPTLAEQIAQIFDDAQGECDGNTYDGGSGSMCWNDACRTLKERVLAALASAERVG
jgi:hypothetical protein